MYHLEVVFKDIHDMENHSLEFENFDDMFEVSCVIDTMKRNYDVIEINLSWKKPD